ncbi:MULTISPECIES: inositol monophosphatase family protein [unclassified Inquilinus]|uniref:inositol monophosphatase family protein n=1 Tax=unclassified Inquilinus TaxID=2645927 RepID=UPI003F900093
MTDTDNPELPAALLRQFEETAVELARLAGAEIVSALGRTLNIRYKTSADPGHDLAWRDPVSEVDHKVESVIRHRLGELFPDHGIIGEEMEDAPAAADCPVWAVDPIDGTTNFINGLPLFAASIGVLHRGRPIVGAVWCSTTHALRSGIYHACSGGPLSFDSAALEVGPNPAVRRRLAGEPNLDHDHDLIWDVRKTGSAAIECAFVAAGLLEVARFESPNVWDVAGGIALVSAMGGAAYTSSDGEWGRFAGFGDHPRSWRQPLIVGGEAAARRRTEAA